MNQQPMWRRWWQKLFSPARAGRAAPRRYRPQLLQRLKVEELEDRTAPSASVIGSTLTITADNTAKLVLTSPSSTTLDVYENGSATPSTFSISSFAAISVTLTGDNSQLILDFSNDNFIPADGITYDGGSGTGASLSLENASAFTNEIETGTGPTSGSIVFEGNVPITFTDVSFIDDTTTISGTATYDEAGVTEALNIVNGGTVNGSQATELNGLNPQEVLPQSTFPTVFFANKPTVVIDGSVGGVSGNDSYTINNPLPAAGLTMLTAGQDGDVGNDQFNVVTPFPSGVTFDIVGGSGTNTLAGPDLTAGEDVWDLTGAGSGSVGTNPGANNIVNSFTNIQNLTGGLGNNTFWLNGGSLTGTIDGGAGERSEILGPAGDTQVNWDITGTNSGSIATSSTIPVPAFVNIPYLIGDTTGAGSDFFQFLGGSLQGIEGSNSAGDTIAGDNNGDTFLITGADQGTIPGLLPGGFFNIGNVRGGTGDNTLVGPDTGATAWSITNYNTGSITYDFRTFITFTGMDNLTGQGNNTFTFSSFGSLAGTLDGGPGLNSTIDGPAVTTAVAWDITGQNAGKIVGVVGAFVNIQYLVGKTTGTGGDTFTFVTGGSLEGSITGGATPANNTIVGDDDGDTFDVTGTNSGNIDGLLPGGFRDIGNLIGGSGNNTLAGPSTGATTWNITAPNAGNISGFINFTAMGSLQGGTSGNTFVFSVGATLSGSINGGTGTNTIDGPPLTNAVVNWSITGTNAGSIAAILPAFVNIGSLIGDTTGSSAGDNFTFTTGGSLQGSITADNTATLNTLVGDNAGDEFTITGTNSGTLTETAGPASFSGIGNLTGGTASNTFVFDGGTLSGAINGGNSGENAIVGPAVAANVVWDITAPYAGIMIVGGIGGGVTAFDSIQNLVGRSTGTPGDTFYVGGSLESIAAIGNAANNSITAHNDNNGDTFDISAANAGDIVGLLPGGFSGIGNLTGGAGDTFNFLSTGSLAGTIGGAGNGSGGNTIVLGNSLDAVTITGTNAGTIANALPNGFTFIQNITGSSSVTFDTGGTLSGTLTGSSTGPNTLIGPNDTPNTWIITGLNSGTLKNSATLNNTNFVNYQNLQGGTSTADDTTGYDNFIFFGLAALLSGSIGSFAPLQHNDITGNNANNTFEVLESFIGEGTVVGLVLGGFSDIGFLQGGSGNNTLVGFGGTWNITAPNAGNIDTSLFFNLESSVFFSNMGTLDGGTGGIGNTFIFSGGATLTGSIIGGTGETGPNTIEGPGGGAIVNWIINGLNAGSIPGVLPSFNNIDSLVGETAGAGAGDTFTFAGGSVYTITGSASTEKNSAIVGDNNGDTFAITGTNAGTVTETGGADLLGGGFSNIGNLTGGSGNNTFEFKGGTLSGTINGGDPAVNTIEGPAVAAAVPWNITGFDSGNITVSGVTTSFTDTQYLVGESTGTGAVGSGDQFTFVTGGSLQGTITATDTAATTNEVIVGDDHGNNFTINGANDGNIAGILPAGFIGIGNLTGGTAANTFTFAVGGSLSGAITGASTSATGDTIIGDNAGDTFSVSGANAGNLAESATPGTPLLGNGFTHIENLTGGTGPNTFVLATGTLSGTINGGSVGPNTIDGPAVTTAVTWNITGAGAGNITSVLTAFVDIQNLVAETTTATGADMFFFTTTGSLAGTITGGATPANETIVGSSSGSSFIINAANAGSIANVLPAGFSKIGNLQGGLGADTFTFIGNGSLSGSIDSSTGPYAGPYGYETIVGNGHGDTFTLSAAQSGNITDNLTHATLLGNAGNGFDNIDELVGGNPGLNTLVGPRLANLWNITGPNAGNITGILPAFANIQNLTGGNVGDEFVFGVGGSLSGTITGGTVEKAQTIKFTQPTSPVSFGVSPITLSASASSALAVTFRVISGPGTITGTKLTVTGTGSIVIEADQAGNAVYAAAPPVQHTLVVNPANQTITFKALSAVTYGVGPITLGATASSGLPIAYTVVSGPGSVSGSHLTITGAGAIVVKATQAGNANYNAATAVTQTLTVNKATLTVTANNATWNADQSGQSLDGFTITGFEDGDTQASLFGTETADVSCPTVNANDPVKNTYVILISQGTLVAPANYKLVFKTGKLTVHA